MNRKQARKHVLEFVSKTIELDIERHAPALYPPGSTDEDEARITAEATRLAEHMRWNLEGNRGSIR